MPPNFAHGRALPDIRERSHQGSQDAMIDAIGYLVRQWAKMLKKVRDFKELDGSNVLDHTSAALVFEVGHGKVTEASTMSDGSHSSENMCVVIAGGAGGMRRGTHVNGQQKHPSIAVMTAMRAAGYTKDTKWGELNGYFSELVP